MRLLGISGSLRAQSSNGALLEAAMQLMPPGSELVLYTAMESLPQFNPDRAEDDIPTVTDFREQLSTVDGVIISSPEYAHGIPGSLKNALDWLVGSGELYEKPVALFNASPPAAYAEASLRETLHVMTATLIPEACISLSIRGRYQDADAIVADLEMASAIRAALDTFALALETK